MKRFFATIIGAVMLFSLIACGNKNVQSTTEATINNETTTTISPTENTDIVTNNDDVSHETIEDDMTVPSAPKEMSFEEMISSNYEDGKLVVTIYRCDREWLFDPWDDYLDIEEVYDNDKVHYILTPTGTGSANANLIGTNDEDQIKYFLMIEIEEDSIWMSWTVEQNSLKEIKMDAEETSVNTEESSESAEMESEEIENVELEVNAD